MTRSRLARIAAPVVALAAAAFITLTTLPALASSVMFYVVDNGGVLITSQHLTAGEVILHGGVPYRVVYTRPLGSHTVFRTIPAVTFSGVFAARG